MCLSREWFAGEAERNARRSREGVSRTEAEHALHSYNSTIWPAAVEMAQWLLANWTPEQFRTLDPGCKDIIVQIVQRELLQMKSVESDFELPWRGRRGT